MYIKNTHTAALPVPVARQVDEIQEDANQGLERVQVVKYTLTHEQHHHAQAPAFAVLPAPKNPGGTKRGAGGGGGGEQ